jgi:Phosphate transport (Pho88)
MTVIHAAGFEAEEEFLLYKVRREGMMKLRAGKRSSISFLPRYRLCVLIVLLVFCWSSAEAASSHTGRHPATTASSSSRFIVSPFASLRLARWGTIINNNNHRHDRTDSRLLVAERTAALVSRGGSSVGEEGFSDGEYDEYDDESEDESISTAIDADDVQIEVKVEKFDEPLVASPMTNLYASLAVMLLSRKIDLFHPTVVKIARFAFIAYLLVLQLFLLYVRVQAKLNNDRTPIELKNPLSSILQSQLGGGGGGGNMMKNLASSFLSSKSTVLEYDLKQTRSMQSGLIFNMMFLWFLHFKMGQVQPVLISTLNGLIAMVYSPLFQVYVLGRNLERPFQNPAMNKMQDAAAAVGEETVAEDAVTATDDAEEEEAEDKAMSDAEAENASEADEVAGEEDEDVQEEEEEDEGAGGSDSSEDKEEDEENDLDSVLNEAAANNDETLTSPEAGLADDEKSDADKDDAANS